MYIHFTFNNAKIVYGSIFVFFHCFCVKHIELPTCMKRATQINVPFLGPDGLTPPSVCECVYEWVNVRH